ncbi:hypothetical protein SFUMM280S_06102 [Streptomyces fumanus]
MNISQQPAGEEQGDVTAQQESSAPGQEGSAEQQETEERQDGRALQSQAHSAPPRNEPIPNAMLNAASVLRSLVFLLDQQEVVVQPR